MPRSGDEGRWRRSAAGAREGTSAQTREAIPLRPSRIGDRGSAFGPRGPEGCLATIVGCLLDRLDARVIRRAWRDEDVRLACGALLAGLDGRDR